MNSRFSKLTQSQYGLLAIFGVIILGSIVRFYKIMFHYAQNGVDEGIQLMASKLMNEGYTLYDDFNTLQAPVGHWIFSLLGGNILFCRLLIAFLSIIGVIGVMFLLKKRAGLYPAFVAGLMMAFSSIYLKESRISSLDMMVTSILIMAFVFLILAYYGEEKWRYSAFGASGILFGLGIMVKLFAVIPFVAVLTYFSLKIFKAMLEKKDIPWKNIAPWILFCLCTICVVTLILVTFDSHLVIEGMFFSNLEVREYQSLTVRIMDTGHFFLINSPILLFSALGMKDLIKEKRWIIPTWFFSLLLWFTIQPLTYNHHLLLLIPPMYIAGGIGIKIFIESMKKTLGTSNKWIIKRNINSSLLVFFLLISLPFFVGAGLHISDLEEPIEYAVAEKVENITHENDFILCGDPIIGIIAGRNQAPEMVNVAETAYPTLNASMIIGYCENYNVPVIVVTYHLSEIWGFKNYVLEYYSFICGYTDTGEIITNPKLDWEKDNYLIYLRNSQK